MRLVLVAQTCDNQMKLGPDHMGLWEAKISAVQ